jgi:hypothetical protein
MTKYGGEWQSIAQDDKIKIRALLTPGNEAVLCLHND